MAFEQKTTIGVLVSPEPDVDILVVPDEKGRLIYEKFNGSGASSEESMFYEIKSADLMPGEDDVEIVVDLNNLEQAEIMKTE